jgi:hypothetical protein
MCGSSSRAILARHTDKELEMSTHAEPTYRDDSVVRAWWDSTQIWAGLSIISMWLAVLFVGIFGPDFTSSSNTASVNGTQTTVPSVIVVAICALLATIGVTHAAFRRRA